MQRVFEKIIDEIEKERVFYFLTIANTGDKILDVAYEKVGEVINRAIEIVKQEAEEYTSTEHINSSSDSSTNGWIPCSERLPETNESVLCWAKSTARGGDVCFVGSCHNGFWFLQSSADTHSFPGQYVIVAWQPIEPYQPKGE